MGLNAWPTKKAEPFWFCFFLHPSPPLVFHANSECRDLSINPYLLLYQFCNLWQWNGISHRHYFRIGAIIYCKCDQGTA